LSNDQCWESESFGLDPDPTFLEFYIRMWIRLRNVLKPTINIDFLNVFMGFLKGRYRYCYFLRRNYF
jgi:hypothetical protein